MNKDDKQVLVTTGATVIFKELIESVINNQFLDILSEFKYNKLIIQYGKCKDGIEFIKKLLTKTNKIKMINQGIELDTGYTINVIYQNNFKISIKFIQFDNKLIDNFTRFSDLVISHAGTGSIIDTLRIKEGKRRLIVMVNKRLKDNHQLEIASAFESLGVIDSVIDGDDLIEKIRGINIKNDGNENVNENLNKTLPKPNGYLIETIIMEELLLWMVKSQHFTLIKLISNME